MDVTIIGLPSKGSRTRCCIGAWFKLSAEGERGRDHIMKKSQNQNNSTNLGRLAAKAAAAESKAKSTRLQARAAKVAFKQARKTYKQAKKAAKEAREQAEEAERELNAASKRAAKLKPKSQKRSAKLVPSRPKPPAATQRKTPAGNRKMLPPLGPPARSSASDTSLLASRVRKEALEAAPKPNSLSSM